MSQLPRYRKRKLASFGKAAQRKRLVRRLEYEAVSRRAKGVCEIPDCGRKQDPLDPHHAFGRGHLPGIPADVCESRDLILGICRQCHDAIHNGAQLRLDDARRLAIARFAEHHGQPVANHINRSGEELVDVMRKLVRDLPPEDPPEAERELKRERDADGPV